MLSWHLTCDLGISLAIKVASACVQKYFDTYFGRKHKTKGPGHRLAGKRQKNTNARYNISNVKDDCAGEIFRLCGFFCDVNIRVKEECHDGPSDGLAFTGPGYWPLRQAGIRNGSAAFPFGRPVVQAA